MKAINPYGMKAGIVKVIPPQEWSAELPPYTKASQRVMFRNPMKQEFVGVDGKHGAFRQINTDHNRTYNLVTWQDFCNQPENLPPAPRGEVRVTKAKPKTAAPAKKPASREPHTSSRKKTKGRKSKAGTKEAPISPPAETSDTESTQQVHVKDKKTSSKGKQGDDTHSSVSARRKNYNRDDNGPKVAASVFEGFDWNNGGEAYPPKKCIELEQKYWRMLTYGETYYGGDVPGSLFSDATKTWNLDKLPNLLDVLPHKIPGVNTAYLYLGMWKATFAWHLEDVDLYSINYLHLGAPKQWYAIAQDDIQKFEKAMRDTWPVDHKNCDQFIRHKGYLLSPQFLKSKYGIKVNQIVHHPGEFIITFPFGYHSGFNLGWNCAEAVNFASESWREYGRVAKRCECSQAQDSVWIDMRDIERAEAIRDGLPWEDTESEEDDEEDDGDDEDDGQALTIEIGGVKKRQTSTKRKRPTKEKIAGPGPKRIKIRINPSREPCVLCTSDISSYTLLPTNDGRRAHKICAESCPDTWIEDNQVFGVNSITKARLELKCLYCSSKKGACIQCGFGKCSRSYHATCALVAGALIEEGETALFDNDEEKTEYKRHVVEYRCRFHRVKREKRYDENALEDNERIMAAAGNLKVGDLCQWQKNLPPSVCAGIVVENRKSEEMFVVDVLSCRYVHATSEHSLTENGIARFVFANQVYSEPFRLEVAYKWLLVADPADTLLRKPTANAKPWVKSSVDVSSLSNRHESDLPRKDDFFVTNHTWAEFNLGDVIRNPAQKRVDLFTKQEDLPTLWYYLPKISTEAKQYFTEDPRKQKHNPKSDFLVKIGGISRLPTSLENPRLSLTASYPQSRPSTQYKPSTTQYKPNTPSTLSNFQSQSARLANTPGEKPYTYTPRDTAPYRPGIAAQTQKDLQALQKIREHRVPYVFGSDNTFNRDSKSATANQYSSYNQYSHSSNIGWGTPGGSYFNYGQTSANSSSGGSYGSSYTSNGWPKSAGSSNEASSSHTQGRSTSNYGSPNSMDNHFSSGAAPAYQPPTSGTSNGPMSRLSRPYQPPTSSAGPPIRSSTPTYQPPTPVDAGTGSTYRSSATTQLSNPRANYDSSNPAYQPAASNINNGTTFRNGGLSQVSGPSTSAQEKIATGGPSSSARPDPTSSENQSNTIGTSQASSLYASMNDVEKALFNDMMGTDPVTGENRNATAGLNQSSNLLANMDDKDKAIVLDTIKEAQKPRDSVPGKTLFITGGVRTSYNPLDGLSPELQATFLAVLNKARNKESKPRNPFKAPSKTKLQSRVNESPSMDVSSTGRASPATGSASVPRSSLAASPSPAPPSSADPQRHQAIVKFAVEAAVTTAPGFVTVAVKAAVAATGRLVSQHDLQGIILEVMLEKYVYFKSEHNRPVSTYKSPYRSDGAGFMNGYEGDAAAHLQQLIRQNPAALSTLSRGSLTSQTGGVGSSTGNNSVVVTANRASLLNSGAPLNSIIGQLSQQPEATRTPQSSSPQLHRAIRQDYSPQSGPSEDMPPVPRSAPDHASTVSPNGYHQSTTQSQKPLMQPPVLYPGHMSSLSSTYPLPQVVAARRQSQGRASPNAIDASETEASATKLTAPKATATKATATKASRSSRPPSSSSEVPPLRTPSDNRIGEFKLLPPPTPNELARLAYNELTAAEKAQQAPPPPPTRHEIERMNVWLREMYPGGNQLPMPVTPYVDLSDVGPDYSSTVDKILENTKKLADEMED